MLASRRVGADRESISRRRDATRCASGRCAVQRERWLLLERLFAEALALPISARETFLARACADDPDLHREINELLRSHDAPGVLDATPHPQEAGPLQPSLPAGTCLGPWRIHELIGRGGMGEVYAATRADGAFEQRAALKLCVTKPGRDSALPRRATHTGPPGTSVASLACSMVARHPMVDRSRSWSMSRGARSPSTAASIARRCANVWRSSDRSAMRSRSHTAIS